MTVPALAQNALTIANAGVAPNGQVVLTVSSANADKLTGLVADLEFDPALCARLSAPSLTLASRVTLGAERVVVDDAEALGCPEIGRLSLVLIDLVPNPASGDAVMPPGSGEIARWTVSIADSPAAAASIPIDLRLRAARNGPAGVPMTTTGAVITCAGNCNADGEVLVNEIIVGVNIAGGAAAASACTPLDTNRDDEVVINELVAAVSNLLNGCRV